MVKRKLSSLATLLAGLTLLLAGCGLFRSPAPVERTFQELYGRDLVAVTSVKMLDGNTGEVHTYFFEDDVQGFLDLLDSLMFRKQANQARRAGYRYWIKLYEGGTETIHLILNPRTAAIDGIYYDLDRDIEQDLDRLFEIGEGGK